MGAWCPLHCDTVFCNTANSQVHRKNTKVIRGEAVCIDISGLLPIVGVRKQSERPWRFGIFHITLALLGVSNCCTEGEIIIQSRYSHPTPGQTVYTCALKYWVASVLTDRCKNSLDINLLQSPELLTMLHHSHQNRNLFKAEICGKIVHSTRLRWSVCQWAESNRHALFILASCFLNYTHPC